MTTRTSALEKFDWQLRVGCGRWRFPVPDARLGNPYHPHLQSASGRCGRNAAAQMNCRGRPLLGQCRRWRSGRNRSAIRCTAVIGRKVVRNDRLLLHATAGPDPFQSFAVLISGHSQPYWMTLSARTRIELGILMPSALAVFMLTNNSKMVGCST